MKRNKRGDTQRGYRAILWDDRAIILPHLAHAEPCGVRAQVVIMCQRAGWTYDSYYLAIFFDHPGLLTETGEGA
jgi:hypothetical protein